jgi:hypothetical protein
MFRRCPLPGPNEFLLVSKQGLGKDLSWFENEKLKLGKWFMVLKNENHFMKIKEVFFFLVKLKIFFPLIIIFCHTKQKYIFFINYFTPTEPNC